MKDPKTILGRIKSDLGISPNFFFPARVAGFLWFMRPVMSADRRFLDGRVLSHPAESFIAASVFALMELSPEQELLTDEELKDLLPQADPVVEIFMQEIQDRVIERANANLKVSTNKELAPEDLAKVEKDVKERIWVSCRTPENSVVIHPSDPEIRATASLMFFNWILDSTNLDPEAIQALSNIYDEKVASQSPFVLKTFRPPKSGEDKTPGEV